MLTVDIIFFLTEEPAYSFGYHNNYIKISLILMKINHTTIF